MGVYVFGLFQEIAHVFLGLHCIQTKGLKKTERETTEEIMQAQQELAEDLEKTMDHLMEEIKRAKDAKKAAEKKE